MAGPLPQTYQYLPVPTQVEHIEEGSISIPATGKSAAGYTVYQVVFKTKTPTPQGCLAIIECNAWKRFSDFQHLEKELEQIHVASGVLVKFPSLIKASYFGRFKDTVVEDRRVSAEALLHFAVHSQHLCHSPPLLDFLKSAIVLPQPLRMAGESNAEPPPPDYNENDNEGFTRGPATERDRADVSISQEELDLLITSSSSTDPTLRAGDPTWRSGGGTDYPDVAAIQVPASSAASNEQMVVSENKRTQGEGGGEGGELDELGLAEWTMGHSSDPWSTGAPFVETSPALGTRGTNLPYDSKSVPVMSSQPIPVMSSQPVPVMSSRPAPVMSSRPAPMEVEATDWWSQALAATQEISDDFDSLVEENEHKCPILLGEEVTPNGTLTDEKVTFGGTHGSLIEATIINPDPTINSTSEETTSSAKPADTPGKPADTPGTIHLLAADTHTGLPSRTSSSESIDSQGRKVQGSNSNSRSPSPPQREANPRIKDKNAYVIQASKLISRALQYEQEGEYQEAFDLLKAGVDLLLNGVQTDKNRKRRDVVRTRTAQYLQHAEELHQKYLSPRTPTLAKVPSVPNVQAVMTPHHLKDFRIVSTIGKVMVVESRHTHLTYVIKVIHRTSTASVRGISMKSRMTVPCPHMVNLLHQYDSANRSFLLLEHIKGGKLIDFVAAKRKQWTSLKDYCTDEPRGERGTPTLVESLATPTDGRGCGTASTEEQLLDELNTLSPPRGVPEEAGLVAEPLNNHTENGLHRGEKEEELGEGLDSASEVGTSEPTASLDRLADLRKQLESLDDGGVAPGTEEVSDTILSVEPPTPVEEKPYIGVEEGNTVGLGLQSKTLSATSLQFTPTSLRGSPDQRAVDDWVQRMENRVREWAAKVVLALEHLHAYGIVCRDLNPSNLLLDNNDSVKLTYFGSWEGVDFQESSELRDNLYMAPELSGCQEVTSAADWWSLGAILFEILTGQTLISCHPDGIHSHLPLHVPISLSSEATALLHQLLQVSPSERIGAGCSGVEELKAHPFFSSVDWTNI